MTVRVMFFDTETTGLPQWKLPSNHPSQPHLCQFTAAIYEGIPQQETSFVDMIVRPDGWTISDTVAALHGITHERALAEGVPESQAIAAFIALIAKADLLCAYGIDFDMRIMRIAMLRNGYRKDAVDTIMSGIRTHCVMRQATPLCRLPPTEKMLAVGRTGFKTPSLTQAVKAMLGVDLEGAHDAAVDVLATGRLYFHMQRSEIEA